ncbi:integrase catalytic domain-containing protein [Trichonephila clavipes]|nr:integrase catalytic domain-containing protein [Trichonephila clavipes]
MCQGIIDTNGFHDYVSVFQEWKNLGIIEIVPDNEINNDGYHLPHRPAKTTKIRPVFDATARESGKLSLNDVLRKGPSLIEIISDISDRFRLYPIGLSADIEKAFLQLAIAPEHREFLRFFYPQIYIFPYIREMVYRHYRVVFEVCSSPFLLAASLNHLLEHSSLE